MRVDNDKVNGRVQPNLGQCDGVAVCLGRLQCSAPLVYKRYRCQMWLRAMDRGLDARRQHEKTRPRLTGAFSVQNAVSSL